MRPGEAAMKDSASSDSVETDVELILVEGLLESVAIKVEGVRSDLVEARWHLQEIVRLSEAVLTQVRPPNPVCTDVEAIHASAQGLLARSSMAFLDY
jgi:hypothetical protein